MIFVFLPALIILFPYCSDEIPHCSSLRVPKIRTIFGVVGMLKLLAGQLITL